MIRFIALTTIALATVSCDKHSWKDTQVLHEKYGGHGAAAHDAAKGSHGAKAETHGEAKPAAHGAEKPKH